jgi:uncharacterized membrane protein YdjX (TVP38/TMEM64 family)
MKKLLAFLNNMDARAWRTVWVSLALLAGVGALTLLWRTGFGGVTEAFEPWLETLRGSWWALPVTVLLFTATSFVMAPAIGLNAVCIIAFGPWLGSVYAMAGTLIACTVHFYIGQSRGPALVQRYGGNTVQRLSRFIERNVFMASAIIRNVPTAPPIIVNMAFGASRVKFAPFLAGAAVGSAPKIAVVAIFGEAIGRALSGGVGIAAFLVIAVIGVWLTFSLAARKAVHEGEQEGDNAETGASGSERPRGDAEPRGDVGGDAGGRRDPVAGRAPEDRA